MSDAPVTPDDLGRSYAEMLGTGNWEPASPESLSASEVKTTTPPPLVRILEALLFVGGLPLTS